MTNLKMELMLPYDTGRSEKSQKTFLLQHNSPHNLLITMAPTSEQLDAFAPLQWAVPHLTSPNWDIRTRVRTNDPSSDLFCRTAMRAHDGVSHWLELHPKPAPGEPVKTTLSLVKFGHGLGGYAGICHGGAILTLMDEALALPYVAQAGQVFGANMAEQHKATWDSLRQGKPLAEVLKGMYVTAKLDIKFLSPVLAPGIVGIETEVLDMSSSKMKVRAVMKDAKGTPLVQAEGVWVKIRGAKL